MALMIFLHGKISATAACSEGMTDERAGPCTNHAGQQAIDSADYQTDRDQLCFIEIYGANQHILIGRRLVAM